MGLAGSHERLDDCRVAVRRWIGVQQFADVERTLRRAATSEACAAISRSTRVAPGIIDVAHIHLQPDAAGDAVDRARENVADADGRHGVARAGGSGGGFYGERDFGGGEKGIAAVRHQHCAGVAALAFDRDAQAGGRGDRGHDAESGVVLLEKRALLDVQFDEGGVIVRRAGEPRERAGKSGGCADFVERFARACL